MIEHLVWLVLWGVVVGLDLVTVPQILVARPLVAGTVAGMIVGDPVAGASVGIVLELFALGVLPVGASRYPDFGLGAVAATAAAVGAPSVFGIGVGVGVGLATAYLGGVGIHAIRTLNGRDVQKHRAELDRGDRRALGALHMRGLGRDALRSLLVTALGLLLAVVVKNELPMNIEGAVYLSVVAVGASLGAAADGIYRLIGRKVVLRWFALGLAGGLVGVVVLS